MNNEQKITLEVSGIEIVLKKWLTIAERQSQRAVALKTFKYDANNKPIQPKNPEDVILAENKVFEKSVDLFMKSIDGKNEEEFEKEKEKTFFKFLTEDIPAEDFDSLVKIMLPEEKKN